MTFGSTEEAARFLLRIVDEEGAKLGIEPNLENRETRSRANEVMVLLKRDKQVFRIRFNWVRDECLGPLEFSLGFAYIQPDWDLVLEREIEGSGVARYHWTLKPLDEAIARTAHPRTLEESWLRRLIHKKLAIARES